jgi:hypothetical protein
MRIEVFLKEKEPWHKLRVKQHRRLNIHLERQAM